jgi:hypothetical protein
MILVKRAVLHPYLMAVTPILALLANNQYFGSSLGLLADQIFYYGDRPDVFLPTPDLRQGCQGNP